MSNLTLTELIDSEVIKTEGQFFRNREICDATGASRQHVSQRMKQLWNDGIIEKQGREWYLVDQGKLVTRLLRAARAQELTSTKLLNGDPDSFNYIIQAMVLLRGSNNRWKSHTYVLEEAMLEDINASIENLRNLRSMIKTPPKSSAQVYQHMKNSGKFAKNLEDYFVGAMKAFCSKNLEGESVIIDDIRARAIEKAENNA